MNLVPGLFNNHDNKDDSRLHDGLFDRGSREAEEKRRDKRRKADQDWDDLIYLDALGFFDDDEDT